MATAAIMTDWLPEVSTLLRDLENLRERFASKGIASKSVQCIQALIGALGADFDVKGQGSTPTRKRLLPEESESQQKISQLKKQVLYQKAARNTDTEIASLGDRVSGRVSNVWLLRASLAPPNILVRPLAQFCREFNAEEEASISRFSITFAKDAFAEV